RIVSPAEHAPAIAALLRALAEQWVEGILAIGSQQEGELGRQRLQPRERRLEFGEVQWRVGRDEADSGRAGARPLDAVAAPEIKVIDAAAGVGGIPIDPYAEPAQPHIGIDDVQDVALVVARKIEARGAQVEFAPADERIRQSALQYRFRGLEVQRLQGSCERTAVADAAVYEGRETLGGEHLAILPVEILQFARVRHPRIGDREGI